MKKLIELWKTDYEHCEAIKPVVEKLEKERFTFEKHNIEEKDGEALWHEYIMEIDANNKKMGYELGYILRKGVSQNDGTRKTLQLYDVFNGKGFMHNT